MAMPNTAAPAPMAMSEMWPVMRAMQASANNPPKQTGRVMSRTDQRLRNEKVITLTISSSATESVT